jgi:hypothetical protein
LKQFRSQQSQKKFESAGNQDVISPQKQDSQQENGLIITSNGPTTPTPNRFANVFAPVGNILVSEFDPMSANKYELRQTLADNFMPINLAQMVDI